MDLPDLPENTVAAFATLCGATVVMTTEPDAKEGYASHWTCLGCGDHSRTGGWDFKVIPQANHHAGLCRSVPLPTT